MVSSLLFATSQELQDLLQIDVEKHIDDEESVKQKATLYHDNEETLSSQMEDDDYIVVGSQKVSKMDITCLESDCFANEDILNTFLMSIANDIDGVSYFQYF